MMFSLLIALCKHEGLLRSQSCFYYEIHIHDCEQISKCCIS